MKMTAIRSSNFRRMLASALMATSAIMGMNLSGCVTYLDSRIAGRRMCEKKAVFIVVANTNFCAVCSSKDTAGISIEPNIFVSDMST